MNTRTKQNTSRFAQLTILLIGVACAACVDDPVPQPDFPTADELAAPEMPDVGTPEPDSGEPDSGEPDRPEQDRDSGEPDRPEPDMGTEPDASADPGCDETCEGACVPDPTGALQCVCDPAIGGSLCEQCATGSTGPDCDACDDGFIEDPLAAGACIPDPCAGDPCGTTGDCSVVTDPTGAALAECACDPGFSGQACNECEAGFTGSDCATCAAGLVLEGGKCVIPACSPFPCGDHGECADADGDGMTECICAEGWTGRDCGTCAMGFVLLNGECIPEACATFTCLNGTCEAGSAGATAAVCVCEDGFAGVACETCAPGLSATADGGCAATLPVQDSLRLRGWFDASRAATLTLVNGDEVREWYNVVSQQALMDIDPASRPQYVDQPQPGLLFDGADILWTNQALIGAAADYTIFAVFSWNGAGVDQTLLDTYFGGDFTSSYRLEAPNGKTVRFEHFDTTSVAADVVEHSDFPVATTTELVVMSRSGTNQSLAGGGTKTEIATTNAGIAASHMTVLGSSSTPGAHGLDGTVHELIFYVGTLDATEHAAIEAYLKAKWAL